MTKKQRSTESDGGARCLAVHEAVERAHQFMTQLNENVVSSVPPSMFLFAKLMSPASN